MLGFGANDLIDMLVIAVVVFKPRKLPPLDSEQDKGVRDYRNAFVARDEGLKTIYETREPQSATHPLTTKSQKCAFENC